jgi:hypothetical protein
LGNILNGFEQHPHRVSLSDLRVIKQLEPIPMQKGQKRERREAEQGNEGRKQQWDRKRRKRKEIECNHRTTICVVHKALVQPVVGHSTHCSLTLSCFAPF